LLETRDFGSNQWHGLVIRLAMLTTHYRQPIDWTVDRLVDARRTWKEWVDAAIGFEANENTPPPAELVEALSDDLNFPEALKVLHGIHKDARGRLNAAASRELAAALRFLGVWGGEIPRQVYGYGYDGPSAKQVQPLIDARIAARAAKNWAESDRIRDELAAMGIALKDNKDGTTTWEVAP